MTGATAVGVDVGGTKAVATLVAPDATVLAREIVETPAEDVPAVLEAMRTVATGVADPSAVAIGVGAAGLVELGTGRMRYAPNIAWRDVDLRAALAPVGLPTFVDNDCTVAAVGELLAGAGRGVSDFLYVGLGTGIGGGIVSDGRVLRGAYGFAGEIGHIVVEPGGPLCGCGNHGCWETVASGSAVTRLGRERLGLDGYGVVAAAHRGDDAARAILSEVGERLGEGLAGLVNVLDPSLVIVGGGAAAGAGDLLLEPARPAFEASVEGGGFRPSVPIVPATLGADGAAIGAALWALEEVQA
jgi:glucokinase